MDSTDLRNCQLEWEAEARLSSHPMSGQFTATFEKLWIGFRARWCDSHDLGGALAFSHKYVKVSLLHRVVQINVSDTGVDTMIDRALGYFRARDFDCAFTLSPMDRPHDLAGRLKRRGFTLALQAVAMACDRAAQPVASGCVQIEEQDPGRYGIWANTMCRSFDFPDDVGALGRKVLDIPEVRLYLATVDRRGGGNRTTVLQIRHGLRGLRRHAAEISPQGCGIVFDRPCRGRLAGHGQSMDSA